MTTKINLVLVYRLWKKLAWVVVRPNLIRIMYILVYQLRLNKVYSVKKQIKMKCIFYNSQSYSLIMLIWRLSCQSNKHVSQVQEGARMHFFQLLRMFLLLYIFVFPHFWCIYHSINDFCGLKQMEKKFTKHLKHRRIWKTCLLRHPAALFR